MTAPCAERPTDFPFRCAYCPVLGWPHAGASDQALIDFATHARCPHDRDPTKTPTWAADNAQTPQPANTEGATR